MKVVQFIVRASESNTSGSRRQLTYLGSREVKKQTGQLSTLCCCWAPSIQSLPLCSICLVHAELLPIYSAPGTSSGVPVLTLRDKLTAVLPCFLRRTLPSCCLCSGKKVLWDCFFGKDFRAKKVALSSRTLMCLVRSTAEALRELQP